MSKRGSSITSLTFGYFSKHNDSRLPPTQCDIVNLTSPIDYERVKSWNDHMTSENMRSHGIILPVVMYRACLTIL